jgi:ubiquinone/menaquinone biosynthesis C-methylase UbiE
LPAQQDDIAPLTPEFWMPEQSEVYEKHADMYERLVVREDYEENILPALRAIRSLEGLDVVEFGAGTGRFTLMLAPLVRRILAFDFSEHMLQVTRGKLRETDSSNWLLSAGDNRSMPLPANGFDLAIAGWSFGHATVWYEDKWRDEIGQSLAEMKRVLRPGGTAVIFETLGTGSEEPNPPTETLAAYYAYLENEQGLSSTWIRTDYQFESLSEAEELAGFFFGDELTAQVTANEWVILPECTGIWWLTLTL